ncbi:MAG: hypothetical protein RLZZ71_1305 [Bacteroidota bacterium]|jgi:hypothetical protein
MRKMLDYFFSTEGKWLRRVLFAAAVVRLIAAVFSEGYIMSDDHFLAVEPVSSWVHGENYHNWFPNAYNQTDHAQPFSYAYYFLNFLVLKFCAILGIANPFIQAFVLRLFHAALSLWGVYLFVKLAERLIDSVQWRMYAIWFWVFGGVVTVFSVHQLVETACIPFVLLAYLYVLKYIERERLIALIIAALAFSVSVGMRYQLVFFPLTLGMYLLWKRKWSGALLFGIFFTLGFALTQIDNLLFWHKPIYQHLLDYQSYNATHFSDYPSNVFSYFALVSYYIFPAITIVFLLSFRRRPDAEQDSSKDALQDVSQDSMKDASQVICIFLGTVVFIGFHLFFPNRQERFLLPAVPFVLLLLIRTISKRNPCEASCKASSNGSCSASCETSFEESWPTKLIRLSIYLSAIYTVSYSFYIPKSKYLEASRALYERGDFQNVVIDNWKGEESVWLPMHYVGKFTHPFSMTQKKSLDQLKQQITHQPVYDSKRLPAPDPNYLIIWGREEAYPRAKQYEDSGFRLQRLSPANSESEQGFALYSLNLIH